MKKALALIICLIPYQLIAGQVPESLQLWKEQANFFWALNFENEEKFKNELLTYYRKMYDGNRLKTMQEWTLNGNLESEYYSSYFNDFRETKIKPILKTKKNHYKVNTFQESCYSLDYNAPEIGSIIETYKVINIAQSKVDEWHDSLKTTTHASVCLNIKRTIYFVLNKNNFIVSEKWQINESILELKPNKRL